MEVQKEWERQNERDREMEIYRETDRYLERDRENGKDRGSKRVRERYSVILREIPKRHTPTHRDTHRAEALSL